MLNQVGDLFDRAKYPIKTLGGRDIGAGHLRGWGLEYGDLLRDFLASDRIYQAAFQAARDRGSLLLEHKLANLYLIIRYAMGRGDIYEFGSYSGGSAVFMATVLKELRMPAKVYAFDTYEGMPPTDAVRDLHSEGDFADTGYAELLAYVASNGLDGHLETVKGEFGATLPRMIERRNPIALMHVDCDIYEPIKYVVRRCLPRLSPASHLVFDDPLHGSCLGAFDAVQELLIRELGLTAEQAYPHLVFRLPALGA